MSRPNVQGNEQSGPCEWMNHVYGDGRGYIAVFSGKRSGNNLELTRTLYFRYPEQATEAADYALRESANGREVYLGAHLLRQKRRIKDTAASIYALYSDGDDAEVPEGLPGPTMVVESSPGRHQYFWRLSHPLPPEKAEKLNRQLTYAIGADASGWDLTQLLRVPDTRNYKHPGAPTVRIVSVVDQAYDPEILTRILSEPSRNGGAGQSTRAHPDHHEPPVVLDEAGMRVWRGENVKHTAAGEIDRSASLMRIGRVLFDAGASRSVIVAALEERDRALEWTKYAERRDAAARYAEIVAELEASGRNPRSRGPSKEASRASNPDPEPENSHETVAAALDPKDDRRGVTKRLADAIIEEDHFAQDAGGKLYRFSEGTYKRHGERFIKRRVKELLEEWDETKKWSSHRANEVAEYILADAPQLWERPPLDEVNVLNGILNVHSKKLRPHSPDFLSPIQLPVAFDPDATCPAWEEFVKATFPEDAQELAYEIPADLMTPDRSEQKSILLLGEGANGKSTYLTAASRFVGSTNIAGLSLHKIENDRFSAARLVGKLANICPDLPSTHLTETSMFKALTGGDTINAEYKYRDSFEFTPFVRLVFSANHPPRSADASHAFFRRWLVVPFEKTFEGDAQIPREELDARLSDPKELSGVLNKALDALPRLKSNGFTESKSMKRAWEEFREMTDPVSVWLSRFTVEHAEAFVVRAELHKAYNDHCEREGRAGMTQKAFTQALKRARPNVAEGQRTVNGERKWCWIGLGRKPQDDPPSPPRDAHLAQDAQDSTNCFLNEGDANNGAGEGEEHSQITNRGKPVQGVQGVHENGRRRLTTEEVRQVQRLISEGMDPKLARAAVTGEEGGLL